jgi:integrase
VNLHQRGPHDCDDRCQIHECRPLARATVRQIHAILRAALTRAVRWGWIAINPAAQATPPPLPTPDPHPPTAEEAARILAEAWKDPDWGLLVWIAMSTGARRGELCALRWSHVDIDTALLEIRSALAQDNSTVWEKSTKTHQHRRIALDQQTVDLLRAHREPVPAHRCGSARSNQPVPFVLVINFRRSFNSQVGMALRKALRTARFQYSSRPVPYLCHAADGLA